jgi:hypothetical protein
MLFLTDVFKQYFLWAPTTTFSNFAAKCGLKGSKYWENAFHKAEASGDLSSPFCSSLNAVFTLINFRPSAITSTRLKILQYVQGASGIDARFFKLSPASAVSPIMTKFSQYTSHSTCYLDLVSICWQD